MSLSLSAKAILTRPLDTPHTVKQLLVILLIVGLLFGALFGLPMLIGVWLPDVIIASERTLAEQRLASGHAFRVVQYWNRVDFYSTDLRVTSPDGSTQIHTLDGDHSKSWRLPLVVDVNDTIIASKNYKKYYYVANTSTVNTHIGYLREDTVAKKVYYLDKTSLIEDLIFDFSLNVGDSIYLNLVPTMNPLPKGYYKVKTIQNTTIKAGIRKEFKLKHTTIPSSDTLRFIESVGSIIHPLYLYKNYFGFGAFAGYPSCPFPYDLGLACKWTNNMKEFQSCTYVLALANGCFFKLDSCYYWNNCGGINELSAIKKVTLSPNPAQNHCVVTLDATQESKITADLIDISGRKIKTFFVGNIILGENEIRLATESLESGLYFISLTGDNFEITQPLTITH